MLTADRRTAQQVLEAGRSVWCLSDNKVTVDLYRRKLEDWRQVWSDSLAAECSKRGVHATLQIADSRRTYERDLSRMKKVLSTKAYTPAVLLWAERDDTLREAGLNPDDCTEMLPYYLQGTLYLDLPMDPISRGGRQLVRKPDGSGLMIVEQGAAYPAIACTDVQSGLT